MLAEFFHNDKQQLPYFIESVDDFPHLKLVKLRGDLDTKALGEINQLMKKAKKKTGILDKNVILDLRKVGQVDTATIAQLLKICTDLKQKKYQLGIMNAPESMRHMIGILKLDKVVLNFESKKLAFSEILAWSKDWK